MLAHLNFLFVYSVFMHHKILNILKLIEIKKFVINAFKFKASFFFFPININTFPSLKYKNHFGFKEIA